MGRLDSKGVCLTSSLEGEFHRLAYFDLAKSKSEFLIPEMRCGKTDCIEERRAAGFLLNEDAADTVDFCGPHYDRSGKPQTGIISRIRLTRITLSVSEGTV